MPVTKRTLEKWRKEALHMKSKEGLYQPEALERADRILRLTQELLDQHLIRRKS